MVVKEDPFTQFASHRNYPQRSGTRPAVLDTGVVQWPAGKTGIRLPAVDGNEMIIDRRTSARRMPHRIVTGTLWDDRIEFGGRPPQTTR
jgi:hypothetical protein